MLPPKEAFQHVSGSSPVVCGDSAAARQASTRASLGIGQRKKFYHWVILSENNIDSIRPL
jgi:hypothetical protein